MGHSIREGPVTNTIRRGPFCKLADSRESLLEVEYSSVSNQAKE